MIQGNAPEETWVVLMRKDKPNLVMGPFSGYAEANECLPDDGWESCTYHNSLEDAEEERKKELVMTLWPD